MKERKLIIDEIIKIIEENKDIINPRFVDINFEVNFDKTENELAIYIPTKFRKLPSKEYTKKIAKLFGADKCIYVPKCKDLKDWESYPFWCLTFKKRKMKPKPLDLENLADEIIRVEYPTYEQTTIPQMKSSVIRKKEIIKQILEQRIREACEFYLINKADSNLDQFGLLDVLDECIKLGLDKKDKKWFADFYRKVKELYKEELLDVPDLIDEYNEWLFRLAFKS